MPDPFDPYCEWLDIRDGGRSPDHYSLLGIKPLESDLQVIAHAADVRMAEVRKIRPGEHLSEWGRLLDHLTAVKICLLDPASKVAYDASLSDVAPAARPTVASPEPPPPAGFRSAPDVHSSAPLEAHGQLPPAARSAPSADVPLLATESPMADRRKKSSKPMAGVMLLIVIAGLGGTIAYVFNRQPEGTAVEESKAIATAAEPAVTQAEVQQRWEMPQPPEDVSVAQLLPEQQGVAEPPSEPEAEPAADPLGEPLPEPEAEPETEPETDQPEPAVDAKKQAAFGRTVSDVRRSMSQRDLRTARKHLNTAGQNAQTPHDQIQLARLQTMLDYLGQFWEGMHASVSELAAGEELQLKDTRIAVVEASRDELTVKAAGRIRTWRVEEMPTSVVMAIAEKSFAKDAGSKTIVGTFLAVDAKGDRARARQLWQEAAREGMDVKQLMAELDDGAVEDAPLSDDATLQQAEQVVRKTFRRQYAAATNRAKKLRLARELLTREPATGEEPAVRFVRLREARDLAVAAGDAKLAVEAVDQMAKFYTVDTLQMKMATLEEVGQEARGASSQRDVTLGMLALLEETIAAKRLDEASHLATLVLAAARKSRNASLMKRALAAGRQVEALQR